MPVAESIVLALLVGGTLLLIAEALIPGAHFVVIGMAMLVTGFIAFLIPMTSPIWLVLVFTVVGVLTLLGYRNLELYGTEQGQTTDSSSLEATEGVVVDTVTPTEGRVRLEGDIGSMSKVFQARSPHGTISEGTEIRVHDSGGGNVLTVVPVDDEEMDEMFGLSTDSNLETELN